MSLGASGLRRWINIIAYIFTVVVNSLAGSTRVLGGKSTADISNANLTLITPAGYVFSVWGVIYVLLGVFVVFQALPSQQDAVFQKQIGWLFVLSSSANIAWLFLWQFEYLVLSVVVMFLLLSALILTYRRLGVGKSAVKMSEKLAVHVPFSVYLGWITIASIANIAVTLVSLRWDGFGISATAWAAFVTMLALAVTVFVVASRRDIAYALVIIWALAGIAVKQTGEPIVVLLMETSIAVIIIASAASLLAAKLRRKR